MPRQCSEKLIPFGMGLLFSHIWIVVENASDLKFHTSDQPVVLLGRSGRSAHEGVGIGSPGVEIRLPLSPEYTLVFLERSQWRDLTARSDGDVFCISDADRIGPFNIEQLRNCRRQLFSIDNDLKRAWAHMAKSPEDFEA